MYEGYDMGKDKIDKFWLNIDVYDILDSVDIGIWIAEYSIGKDIHRFYGNKTMKRLMGLNDAQELSPEDFYNYWYERIEKYYLKDVEKTIYNAIKMYNKNPDGYITDEVCYIWNHDQLGKVNIRCGGKVINFKDEIYTICGYHQDYTEIIKNRYSLSKYEERNQSLIKVIEDITYLKDYYQGLAYVDELTGLVNRRGFYEKIESLLRNKMRRKDDCLWLAILDLDFFKKVNDRFGHLNGDKLLRSVSEVLFNLGRVHKHSYVFRYGGEEFIILIYQKNLEEVQEILNECREKIKSMNINFNGDCVNITCSIGVTQVKALKGVEENKIIYDSMKKADKALYRAKENGRDCLKFES